MDIQEFQQGAVVVLKPLGPLVDTDAASFRDRTLKVAENNMGRVIVDATGITFLDSKGIEALVEVTEQLGSGGRALKLCSANPTLKRVLELTGWASSFEFFDDTNCGVRSFL